MDTMLVGPQYHYNNTAWTSFKRSSYITHLLWYEFPIEKDFLFCSALYYIYVELLDLSQSYSLFRCRHQQLMSMWAQAAWHSHWKHLPLLL
jgi:hypothetical protein